MSCTHLDNVSYQFSAFTEKPVKFLTVQENVKEDIKNLVKSLYDFTKSQEKSTNTSANSALPELIVKDFDEEQIWQEIELQNTQQWDHLVWDVAQCMSSKDVLVFPITTDEDKEISAEQSVEENDHDSLSETENLEPENVTNKKKKEILKKLKGKPSVVDDQFFKLQEMEQFLLKEEKIDGNQKQSHDSDEESIDMFENIEDDASEDEEGGKVAMYSGFFENDDGDDMNQSEFVEKAKKSVKFAGLDSESETYEDDADDEDVNQPELDKKSMKAGSSADLNSEAEVNDNDEKDEKKSEFQMRQQRLKLQINRLEDKTLCDAPWQLKGEVDANRRPQNSLLQEVIDFDLTTRPPPIITEQTTETLEDIIRRRIKDKAWDDVIKKEKPVDDILSFRKPEVLDHSKSQLSLAQVYEAEYLKQKHASTDDNKDEKEPESHTEIRTAMSKLFAKLDALSHYHYTPKAAQPEVKIISNTPAISMEEVAPIATSNAALLAPEEVKKKLSGDLLGKQERTKTDRNRERRKKKKFQKEKGSVTKVTQHRNTKNAVASTNQSDKALKTSKAFFQQLNDDTTSVIKSSKNLRKNVKNKGL